MANDVAAADSGFEVDTNRVTLLDPSGAAEALPLMSKSEAAERIVDRLVGLLPPPEAAGPPEAAQPSSRAGFVPNCPPRGGRRPLPRRVDHRL